MMLNIPLFLTGFFFGTFKFLFAHWTTFGAAAGMGYEPHYYEIFISVTSGGWVSMTVFYFLSELLMKRAAKKRHEKYLASKTSGIPIPFKRKFTRINKILVKMKRGLGIYGLTVFAPLFLSIPIGSIVCAKFFGHDRRTFPLMLLFSGLYSFLMCFLIWLAQ
ncbi:MAG: hypothetical protein HYZ14_04195 [Bacteroidetes bacterium]|nr:hypothetical protein [Bacteroidota bacterium]